MQAGALLAKLMQTLIYTCCCLFWHKGAWEEVGDIWIQLIHKVEAASQGLRNG